MQWMLKLIWLGLFACQIDTTIASGSTPYSYNNLIQKYSDSSKFLTIKQLQMLLDKIHTFVNHSDLGNNFNSNSKCEHQEMECGRIHQGCLTAKDLFTQLNIKDGKFDTSSFESACPLILAQVESNACNTELPAGDMGKVIEAGGKPTQTEVWGLGILFVTVISLCSLIGVSVMPLMEKTFYKQLLTVLIGLAVGSLSASSIFHLIPQAFNLIEGEARHEYLNISLTMWFGIWFFFMVERILKVITDARQRSEYQASADKLSKKVFSVSNPLERVLPENHEQEPLQLPLDENSGCIITDPGVIYDYQKQAIKASFGLQEKARVDHSQGHGHIKSFQEGRDSVIATVAWMVIFGDGLHNFIDGLSIGAAFNQSILTGISISLAVLCEEFPHELGDFAVLLNAGMTMRQALLYNFLSACTCYLGLIVGIVLGEVECSTAIFGFAAGMFLYISLVDMVPEMNEVVEEASKVSAKKACITLLLQNLGMGIGMISLYALARYQGDISFT